jgi:flagellin
MAVNVDVVSAATQAQLGFPYAALGASTEITIEIRGSKGVTSLSFGSNTSATQIGNAIASVADATGISATLSNGGLSGFSMITRGYGSEEFVKVRVLGTGTFGGGTVKQQEAKGIDATATVNGSVAAAKGNHIEVKTANLDLELDLHSGFASTTSFTITGGGALFQVGPHVNPNLQVNIGVQSVASTALGNTDIGFLAQLKTGGQYALAKEEYDHASDIVDKAIDQISVLRGRLGSFERGTLDTNINQLGITMENLMSAESTIRDADFAYETSQLARNQVLVSAGTTVLTLANQTTQSVLRLLGG